MVAPYPKVDPRRASALQGELAAMARTLVPGWRGTQGEGDAGWALLQIAARLSEHVTRRLDETARRDALAFFSLLDIPPPAARAAEAPVVFALAEKRTTAVIAPERTQLTASARDEELVFETTSAATLTPARLDRVITVDGQADRIEEAPRAVLSLAPPSGAPTTFTAVTFADAGSTTLQLTPSLGLEPEDLLRIGEAAYRVKEAGKNGLIELHEPLENALPAAATVTKITRLESFTLRDRQEHVVFVGHKELLKLDGLAIITLNLEPPGLARALAQLDLAFELWGTGESEKEPGWQELVRLSAAGGKLRLAKAWTGTVDETELGEHKNRFLRLRLRSPITGAAAPVSPLSTLTLGVQSLQPKPEDMPNEGAFGITAAVHNGSPLPLTGAFLPFGPEPQRFDVFAFAAPEMLSKRGATATVTVTLLDGSVAALAIGAGLSEAEGIAVAIGTNGELRTLRFGADRLGTDLLGHPTLAESSVGSAVPDAEPTSLRLAPGPNLATLTVNADGLVRHLVVATDLAGRIWSIALRRLADGSIKRAEPWQLLEDVQPNRPPPRNLLLLPLASPSGSAVAFALVQRDDGMRISRVRKDGAQQGAWRLLRAAAAGQEPELGSATQVVPVRAAQWPALRPEIVVLDEAGTFFHGVIDEPANEVVWAQVGAVGGGSNAVRPAAAVLTDDTDDRLLTQGADPAGRLLTLVDGSIESNPAVLDAFTVVPGTRIELAPHPDPAADRFPIVMAFGTAGDAGASILLYHRPFAPELLETPLVAPLLAEGNGQARSLVGGLIVAEGAPRAVFAGEQETAAQRVVSGRAVTFDLHDALIFDPGTVPGASSAPGFVALDPGPDASIIELGAPVIEAGTMKVYAAASGTLSPDQPYSFFPSLGDAFNGELEEDGGELRLRLDAADSSTVAGTLLLLHRAGEQLSVKVADRTAANGESFATFESDVTMQAGEVSYLPHLAAADRVVAADDLQTFLEITAGVAEWPETSAALRFGQDIDPATQTVRAASAPGASPWVLVSEAWSSAPADGAAALLVSQAATAWQIDDFTVPFN
ncbi:MAG TPA: hypothetical protein VE592_13895, partial [Geminicoccaceae bacterium]|nr:hypothetical protein [Geminicoccaceae bacterium]